jgi:hypothetical protein
MEYKLPVDYTKLEPSERCLVREQYVKEQKGLCLFCKANLSEKPTAKILKKTIDWSLFPENFLKYPIHLQHDHDTNMTEGAVHNYCNAVMWQYHGK